VSAIWVMVGLKFSTPCPLEMETSIGCSFCGMMGGLPFW